MVSVFFRDLNEDDASVMCRIRTKNNILTKFSYSLFKDVKRRTIWCQNFLRDDTCWCSGGNLKDVGDKVGDEYCTTVWFIDGPDVGDRVGDVVHTSTVEERICFAQFPSLCGMDGCLKEELKYARIQSDKIEMF